MSKPKKINWEEAKASYVANRSMSLKQVAENYNISYSYLQNISQREGWVKEKEERWKRSEKEALEEVEGSIKDLIIRHAKVARFLQAGGVKRLQKRLKELDLLDSDPSLANKVREMDDRTLIALVSEGLKAERELYPKQMEIKGDVGLKTSGLSKALDKAIYDSFRKTIGRKRPSIHRSNKKKKLNK